jgi:hypothetical protein
MQDDLLVKVIITQNRDYCGIDKQFYQLYELIQEIL